MAKGARAQAQRQRATAREQRRSAVSQPVEALDDAAAGGEENGAGAVAAAKRAARTAAAAAIAGGLAGAAKALIERRSRAREDEDDDQDRAEGEDEERERAAADQPRTSSAGSEEERSGDSIAAEAEDVTDEAQAEPEADEQPEPVAEARGSPPRSDGDSQRGASSADVAAVVARARSHVENVLGKEAETVSGISRADGSWAVTVEVVEVRRIPDSTDILSSYEVALDDNGDLLRLERRGRYRRSQVEEER